MSHFFDSNCCGHGHDSKRRHRCDCDGRHDRFFDGRHDRDCRKRDHAIVQCFGDNCFEVQRRFRKDCGCNHW